MLRILSIAVGLFPAFTAYGAEVHVWQDSISLPTYAEHDPDTVPQFAAFKASMPNYPYPVRSRISDLPEDRSTVNWRTLNLENEYLFCRILPDLGGHLYNCRDKMNQREVFYANPVIKKDLVGLRGAWIATGIEPNFPVTHSRATAAPVNFLTRSYPDGSAAVIVGDTDRVTGLSWRVEYRLRPKTAVLEQEISLYNPTAARKPYLWWNNAQIEWDDPGLRYVYPTKMVLSHDRKTLDTWPVNSSGVDISIAANSKTEATWFAYQCRDDFMAIYKPKSRTGVAHYADPKVVSGKKIWIMADQTEYYKRQITDGGNVYVEMQAGLFTDQQAYEFLQPEQSRTFTEYWIPFRELGGVTRVTPDLALYAQRGNANEVRIELEATHPMAGARIRLLGGARVISEFTVDLDPNTVWKQGLQIPAGESYGVQVVDAKGKVVLEHEEGRYAAAGPAGFKPGPRKVPDWNAPPHQWLLLKRGDYNESASQIAFARGDYESGLQALPGDPLLSQAAGRLDVGLLRSEDALKQLGKRIAQRADPEASYYAGVAQTMQGHDEPARPLFGSASAAPRYATPATLELARIASRAHDFAGALKLPEASPKDPMRAARIAAIRAALLRRSGDRTRAAGEIEKGRAVAPEDPFLRYEAILSGTEDPALRSYLAGDGERVLNIADEYLQLGLWEDALILLQRDFLKDNPKFLEPGAVPPDQSALVAYYRAYCEIALKKDPATDLRRASELGTRYMFPYRASSYAVLGAAIEHNPSDAVAHALMGNLEMYSFRTGEAIAEWTKAITSNPKLEVERKTMTEATALLNRKPAPIVIATVAKKTISPSAPAAIAPHAAPIPVTSRVSLAESAMISSVSGSPDAAAAVFQGPEFASDKQPAPVRQAYIEVQLQSLLALSLAGNCDALEDRIEGLPIFEDTKVGFTFQGFSEFIKAAHFQYYLGLAEANCGRPKQARKYWSKVAKMKEAPSSPDFAYPLLAAAKVESADVKSVVAEAQKAIESDGGLEAGLRELSEGLLLRANGQEGPAAGRLSKALQSKNAMVRYLSAVELARKQR